MEVEIMALMIPIIGIIFGIAIAFAAITYGHREKLKRAELRHRERMAAIERGIEVPPEREIETGARAPLP